jgi:hypothetical protein
MNTETYVQYNCSIHIRNPKKKHSIYSVVGIANGYGLDDCGVGVRVPVG